MVGLQACFYTICSVWDGLLGLKLQYVRILNIKCLDKLNEKTFILPYRDKPGVWPMNDSHSEYSSREDV